MSQRRWSVSLWPFTGFHTFLTVCMQIPARSAPCFTPPVCPFSSEISVFICLSVCYLWCRRQTDARGPNGSTVAFEDNSYAMRCFLSLLNEIIDMHWNKSHVVVFSGLCQGPVWCVCYGPVPTKTGLVSKLLYSVHHRTKRPLMTENIT